MPSSLSTLLVQDVDWDGYFRCQCASWFWLSVCCGYQNSRMAGKTTLSLAGSYHYSILLSAYESQQTSPILQHSLIWLGISLAQALKTSKLDENLHSFHTPPISWSHNSCRYLNDISLNLGYLSGLSPTMWLLQTRC